MRRVRQQEIHEHSENELLQIRRKMANEFERDPVETIVHKIMRNIPCFLKKYTKFAEENDEIKRRLSMLDRSFIAIYVDRAYRLYHSLGFTISAANIVEQTIFDLTKRVPRIPDFCEIADEQTQEKIVDLIKNAIIRVKNERYVIIKAERSEKQDDNVRNTVVRSNSEEKIVKFDSDASTNHDDDDSRASVHSFSKKGQDKIVSEMNF